MTQELTKEQADALGHKVTDVLHEFCMEHKIAYVVSMRIPGGEDGVFFITTNVPPPQATALSLNALLKVGEGPVLELEAKECSHEEA